MPWGLRGRHEGAEIGRIAEQIRGFQTFPLFPTIQLTLGPIGHSSHSKQSFN
jgi:hypothetical protein